MNELDNLFQSTTGLDMRTMRAVFVVCLVAVGVLYIYRLLVVVHCMRQPAERFTAPIDRLIWVGLAMFVPLGLGAWLYDVAQRQMIFRPMFCVPFIVIAFCVLRFGIPLLFHMTNFKFDFLGI